MGTPSRRPVVPPQQRRHPAPGTFIRPHRDDPDRRPLLTYADPRPRPTTRGWPHGWTPQATRAHKQRVARSLAALAFLGACRRDVNELRAELAHAHTQIAELRLRADWGHDLADAQRRARTLEAQLLADEAVGDADTDTIAAVRESA